jgi:deazaflavin-dependent oxidoreductase (nitroreductase family)
MCWLDRWQAEDFCYLTTTGRRTGRPHEIEIWFGSRDGRLYMLSGGLDQVDWVKNLRVEPRVRVRIGDETRAGIAYEVQDPAEDALARRLLAAKYQGWRDGQPMSGWARTALPVAVEFPESVA